MKNSMKSMMITAAVSGLLGGTAARLQAAPAPAPAQTQVTANSTASNDMTAGKVSYTTVAMADADKHSCKGKNDCKGQGGCKSSDNGCKGKNSCKGKGGCATDGSMKH
ncbi:MAG TPA: hypothetical protein VGL97_04650 [Bryobacteraceae bacterium]|jgi:hypothetical protein